MMRDWYCLCRAFICESNATRERTICRACRRQLLLVVDSDGLPAVKELAKMDGAKRTSTAARPPTRPTRTAIAGEEGRFS